MPPDDRVAKLRASVESVYGATLDKVDLDKLADSTHPRALKAAGGRDEFKRVMKQVTDFSKAQFESLTCSLGEPKLYEGHGSLIGVVPRILDGVTVTKNSLVMHGTIVGISEDDGKTWRFVNGTSFARLFPEFADVVMIPKEETFINGVEQ